MPKFDPMPLNQQPQGLLDFFQVKTGGTVFPETFSDVLVPTWDLRDHYFTTNAQYQPATPVAFATATNTQLTVVTRAEHWRWMVNLSLHWVPAAAADAFFGQIVLVSPTNIAELPFPVQPVSPNFGVPGSPGLFNFPASAGLTRLAHNFTGFWVPPGFSVNVLEIVGTNGGAAVINATWRIANLRQ